MKFIEIDYKGRFQANFQKNNKIKNLMAKKIFFNYNFLVNTVFL